MWRFSLMLPFSKRVVAGCLFLLLPLLLTAQPCKYTFSGQVFDQSTGIALPFATVFLEEVQKGAVTDSAGFFEIPKLCRGEYKFRISHVGCETLRGKINLKDDKYLVIHLNHFTEFLNEVVIHGKKEGNNTRIGSSVPQQTINENSNKNVADILKTIQGVNVLKSGTGISKPVIHGLYGNRIGIINNGIVHSGQQWGNDHAPEIDPFAADHLAVVKGTSALQYAGGTLGGLILADTKSITDDRRVTGNVNYIGETNGLGNTVNTQLEKAGSLVDWRFTGTFKLKGDQKTPDYFLTNTGKRESNASLQMEKMWNEQWNSEFYYSLFSTETGILRGSHIGNLTDLKEALQRDIPFYTKNNFSYQINAPSQNVKHHLLKLNTKYQSGENSFWEFTYGGQINDRKEFDVRRSGRSGIPALSLYQIDHSLQ
ncbi:MAG: carboxypeptidase-like regulatory domain-containing protein, partial [Prolixibacteraceae bacterium]